MTERLVLRIALILFAVAVFATLAVRESRREAMAAPAGQADAQAASPKVIAYYFHTTYRCVTCRAIEAFSHEAIEQGFAQALKDGKLDFRVVNVEERANQHFVREYQLFTKSLILVKMKDGKQAEWKNLSRVWELVRRKDAFLRYVQDEVRAYLEAS
jgi:hypothetical protein